MPQAGVRFMEAFIGLSGVEALMGTRRWQEESSLVSYKGQPSPKIMVISFGILHASVVYGIIGTSSPLYRRSSKSTSQWVSNTAWSMHPEPCFK